MKKIIISVLTISFLFISNCPILVHSADDTSTHYTGLEHVHDSININNKGVVCLSCGAGTVRVIQNAYWSSWEDYERAYCTHSYSNGYDQVRVKCYFEAVLKCSSCGWSGGGDLVDREFIVVCHGY